MVAVTPTGSIIPPLPPTTTTSSETAALPSNSRSSTYENYEDRLLRTWRSLVQTVIVASSKAEKVAKLMSNDTNNTTTTTASVQVATGVTGATPPPLAGTNATTDHAAIRTAQRDTEKVIIEFIRYRMEWDRLLTNLDAQIQGKAMEVENRQQYVRCQPSLGLKRKRKCEELDEQQQLHQQLQQQQNSQNTQELLDSGVVLSSPLAQVSGDSTNNNNAGIVLSQPPLSLTPDDVEQLI